MKSLKNLTAAATAAFVVTLAPAVQAQATMDGVKTAQATAATTTTAASDMTDGEVRKIDKDSLKITLKHGEIKNLEMPGMTMVFRVKDAEMLDKVQVGSIVKFVAEKLDGGFFVTAIHSLR